MKYKPYRYLLYLGLCLVQAVFLWIPQGAAAVLARRLGEAAFLLARRERRKTLQHLTGALGHEKSPREIEELGRRVFIHFALTAAEVLRFPRLDRETIDRWVDKGNGLETFDRVLSEGRGAILLTAHLGNWELMGALFMLYGYPGVVVGKRIYYDKFNQALLDLRKKVTLRTIYQDASPRELLKVLHENQILGILADQDVDRLEGIFVPFFGRPAYTLTSPVKLALATGAPLIPAFVVRTGDRYRLIVEEPIRVEMKGTREETLQEYTARWSRVIEEKIRAYPDQWAWMHPRWKTQPAEDKGTAPACRPGRRRAPAPMEAP